MNRNRCYLSERKGALVCKSSRVLIFEAARNGYISFAPEMKSTGEAIGYDKSMTRALYKGA